MAKQVTGKVWRPSSSFGSGSSSNRAWPLPRFKTTKAGLMRDRLVNELSHLRLWLAKQKQPLAPGALQQQFPSFKLWDLLTPDEVAELAAGEKFLPRAYADNLVLRKYGLTSRETLRKDRQMLRRYERRQAAFGAH